MGFTDIPPGLYQPLHGYLTHLYSVLCIINQSINQLINQSFIPIYIYLYIAMYMYSPAGLQYTLRL